MRIDVSADTRAEVHQMCEALRAVVRRSDLEETEVERSLGLAGGGLRVLLADPAELRVAHVFRILQAIGIEPRRFFLALRVS